MLSQDALLHTPSQYNMTSLMGFPKIVAAAAIGPGLFPNAGPSCRLIELCHFRSLCDV